MSESIKMCNMSASISGTVFMMLNKETVLYNDSLDNPFIITDTEPKDLIYPEGWYYAKGCFRNKHTSTNGTYSEIVMLNSHGEPWKKYAKYCTLEN